ncbi:DUF6869 domain-containing protein [Cryptosporangium japonicum]|uniref:DUF6869 domain-containing protein n=1 Tax=Cryptosporangium japonicum TaxID=80872 RepID=A0ABP3ES56_9ACTN
MSEPHVRILGDGSCELLTWLDYATLEDVTVRWESAADLAGDWLIETRAGTPGPAFSFLWSACHQPLDGIVSVLVALANAAGDDEDMLGGLGAGWLEDLIPIAGKVPHLLDELERAARQKPTIRAALGTVWMGADVPPDVRQRFRKYGARDVTADGSPS